MSPGTPGGPSAGAVPRHLVLVGLMGTGKSTVGRRVAARLGRPFRDCDELVEARAGRTVREIFAAEGEDAFRAAESSALLEALAADEPTVIAAGGGAVLRAENRRALRDPAVRVVWLCAEPATLVERVRTGAHRPLLDEDPAGTLAAMQRTREALYREVADAIVGVDRRSVEDVVEAVLR